MKKVDLLPFWNIIVRDPVVNNATYPTDEDKINWLDDLRQPSNRKRNYCTIVYPDSAPPDWIQRLDNLHIPAIISPLHEFDINDDGTPKKPHYHVMVNYGSPVTYLQFNNDVRLNINGVGIIMVKVVSSMAKYFIHKNNPEKYQYDASGVICLGGADYISACSSDDMDDDTLDAILQYCNDHSVQAFCQLVRYCQFHNRQWFKYLKKNSFIIREFIKSSEYEAELIRSGRYLYHE